MTPRPLAAGLALVPSPRRAQTRPLLSAQEFDPAVVLAELLAALPPLDPMPVEPTSNHCGMRWWDALPYGPEGVGFLCTERCGHDGVHRAHAPDGRVMSEYMEPLEGP